MSFIYSMTSTIWFKNDLHGWILKPGILFVLNCTYLYIYTYLFCESVCTDIWYEWHGCCLVSWALTEKQCAMILFLDLQWILLMQTCVTVFPGFDMQVACLFISFRLFSVYLSVFKSFAIVFPKVLFQDGSHTLLYNTLQYI